MPRDDLPPMSAARKGLLWWFRWPANPHVCLSFAVEFGPARDFLARLREANGPGITVNVLLAATIGRLLREFPVANQRIVGRRIAARSHVSLALPVDRLGRGSGIETAMAVVRDVADCSLVELAERCGAAVRSEREGRVGLPWARWLVAAADRLPLAVLEPAFDTVDRLGRFGPIGERLYASLPGAALTNVGAVVGRADGMVFRAASWSLPQRLMHVGTVWGISAVQDEVVAANGLAVVKPMLPVVLGFDHRLFDGAFAARLALRFGAIVRDPAAVFGADGRRPPEPAPA
jgi:pyruvate dehydrogenase E2 component (dihydrolipoamide acetyltransferase)